MQTLKWNEKANAESFFLQNKRGQIQPLKRDDDRRHSYQFSTPIDKNYDDAVDDD